ncbi:endonuclease domain-containing protein [Pseudonocardia ailaonensis]|uniref:endonuclease domain-containing protein n=1 Tax=Pseudonocardia ailaonensis TaxID=367279 RepID=UPI0031DE7C4F
MEPTEALVSGPAAAWWHGMLARPEPIVDVTVPRAVHRSPRAGVVLHRRPVAPEDRERRRGIALVGRARAALETAVALPDGAVFLDRALQRHVSFAQLGEAASRMVGARGSPRVGRLLTAAADHTASLAEREMVTLLRAGHLDGWVVALPFDRWTVDVAFPDARIAVEFDSWVWHVDVGRFVNDRRKGNALVAAGWTLLRFTWHDITGSPPGCSRRSARHSGRRHDHHLGPVRAEIRTYRSDLPIFRVQTAWARAGAATARRRAFGTRARWWRTS